VSTLVDVKRGASEAITFERDYWGTIDQARHVRADLANAEEHNPSQE
jgi:hypothetical protein